MVASIPPVQILDGVRVDIPATVVGVPVRVHNPESFHARSHPYHCPLNILRTVFYAESCSLTSGTNYFVF